MRLQVLVMIAGLAAGGFGFKHLQDKPDLSTPKATLQSLVSAYSRHDVAAITQCVSGGSTKDVPEKLLQQNFNVTNAECKNVLVEVSGKQAKAAVEYEVSMKINDNDRVVHYTFTEMFSLQKGDSGWLIEAAKLNPTDKEVSFGLIAQPLHLITALIGPDPGYRNAMGVAVKQSEATLCLSNTKQIALGCLMYTQDYDEVMPRSAAKYNSLVEPYIKSQTVFQCPLDVKGAISYSMNANLQNRTLADITNPANTVLLYEGKNGKIDFRHEGKAAIAFADGHAKLLTEAETKSLIWKIPPPKPVKTPAKPAKKRK